MFSTNIHNSWAYIKFEHQISEGTYHMYMEAILLHVLFSNKLYWKWLKS